MIHRTVLFEGFCFTYVMDYKRKDLEHTATGAKMLQVAISAFKLKDFWGNKHDRKQSLFLIKTYLVSK